MVRYFQTSGEGIEVVIDQHPGAMEFIQQSIKITSLIPGSDYAVYCYAEDSAQPEPNRMTAAEVQATMRRIRTEAKVPTIRIARRQTMYRGFRLFVVGDAPGHAWCAAAPVDYGVPDISEIVHAGATAEIVDPGQSTVVQF